MGLLDFRVPSHITQAAFVRKPAAVGRRGVVVTQSRIASEVALAVLEAGGNAADAAVAAAFVLASSEPWNSGLGGVGFGLIRKPDGEVSLLDFGPIAPGRLGADHFPLTGRPSTDIFGWPEVVGARNVNGSLSHCVPSAVAGYGLLHAEFGRLPREELLAPAVAVARRGMAMDWYSTIKIAQSARLLADYEESARIYLPGGFVPIPPEQGSPSFLHQGKLADTIEAIRSWGFDDFYRGHLSSLLLEDLKSTGSLIDASDLSACRASLRAATSVPWRGRGQLFLPDQLTAAPTLVDVMGHMENAALAPRPDASWFVNLAHSLSRAYTTRLAGLGDTASPAALPPGTCTSHLNIVDQEGMAVSLTTTIVGTMGSRQVLPRTGILMNNGAMWFDPRPHRPNSVAGGKRPLTNMLPAIFVDPDRDIVLAVGASGGRRILSSVYQMLAFVLDFNMSLEDAAHHPRIDVSGPARILADRRLAPAILELLKTQDGVEVAEHGPVPLNFACPSAAQGKAGLVSGVSDTMTPWSLALAQ